MSELTKIQTSRLKTEEVTNAVSGRVLDDKITNCITEIPQDIKLELVDGTLTLKSGSKVYVPNGVGKFDVVTIARDITYTNNFNGVFAVFTNTSSMFIRSLSNCFSGAPGSVPVFSGTGAWYDTTNNLIKISSDSGATWNSGTHTLPFAIITISNGIITSIDQTFNGFGYIGSTVFALPGVKGLIPNGRNEDGTLKNNVLNIKTVLTRTFSGTTTIDIVIGNNYFAWNNVNYNENDNHNYSINDGWVVDYCNCGYFTISSSKITSLQPKTTFHAVDYNDFKELDNEVVKITGNQTISGVKTFTNPTIISTTLSQPLIVKGQADFGQTQLSQYYANKYNYARVYSENTTAGKYLHFDVMVNDDGTGRVAAGGNINSFDVLLYNASQVRVPTPTSATDNSTNAATTAWCTKASQEGNLFGAPNYSAGVSKTKNTTYTAEKNGWLMFIRAYTDRGSASSTLTIGGISMVFRNNSDVEGDAYMFPIGKGQTYSFTGETLTFYPCL